MSHRCALEKVHQRMDDAYRHWHQAMNDYFDPDGFRASFNACIQALRTVTWVLQGLKNDIEGLEEWYLPWQESMKQDNILKWLVTARNKIEHKGDIDAKSKVFAAIIASHYRNEVIHAEVNACILDTVSQIFSKIPMSTLHDQIIAHGTLRLERRWEDEELPGYEILDALRHAYAELSKVIDDAHKSLLKQTCPKVYREARERLGAMTEAGEETRSGFFSLKTGKQFSLASKRMPLGEKDRALKRYGTKSIDEFREWPTSLPEACKKIFSIARHIFLKDGYHKTMAFLLKDLVFIELCELEIPDRMSKYLIMQSVASAVQRTNATEVILISEIWRGPLIPEKPYYYPADRPDRQEALTLTACSSRGEIYSLSADIICRKFRKVTLGSTDEVILTSPAIIAPILDVWGIAHAGNKPNHIHGGADSVEL